MPLSASTLFHFTNKKNILSILNNCFRVFYCKETLEFYEHGDKHPFLAPMVSFCDLPLSEAKDHISSYGKYGIGLSKEWGVNNKLNPVLYLSQNSTLSISFVEAFNRAHSNSTTEEQKAMRDIFRYIKNYEGEPPPKKKSLPVYRYSDEREWRYVPEYSTEFINLVGSNDLDKQKYNAEIADLRLNFEPKDIRYLIISKDSEIPQFIKHIRKLDQAKGGKYPSRDIDHLTTRILTVEQIKGDM